MSDENANRSTLRGPLPAPPRVRKEVVRDAVAWLLLAYSLGHTDDCQCEHCPGARQVAYGKDGSVAA